MTPTRDEVHTIFKRIEQTRGVVMRGNYLCCQTCAHAALDKEGAEDYGFYHVQSLDAAAYDGWLYIGHGCDETAPRAIVEAFREAGCEVEWPDESPDKTIRVKVDAASFSRENVANIPSSAERVDFEDATICMWEDEFATDDNVWQVRIMSDDNVFWYGEFTSRAKALAHAEGVVMDLADEDADA